LAVSGAPCLDVICDRVPVRVCPPRPRRSMAVSLVLAGLVWAASDLLGSLGWLGFRGASVGCLLALSGGIFLSHFLVAIATVAWNSRAGQADILHTLVGVESRQVALAAPRNSGVAIPVSA
jgi:hypothetical protein